MPGHRTLEVSLYVNDAFLAHHHKPARARLRGLVGNPVIGADLLRLVDEHLKVVKYYLGGRREWSDEQFDALVDHPDPAVRVQLAQALHVRPEQRARLVEDPAFEVLLALAEGPDTFDLPITRREPLLPLGAYQRLIERDARLREAIATSRWVPQQLRDRLTLSTSTAAPPAPVDEALLDRREAEELAGSESTWTRACAAADPRLPAVLATDDDFAVRLLLCENHADVAAETVLTTYLEARTMTRGRLLGHPAFPRAGLARLADSPDPGARCLVVLDPDAAPELVERLSHDPHPAVRASMAPDRRVSPGRVLELFDDPLTTEYAAANPHLPVPVMQHILADAVTLADERIEGTPTVYLGN